MGEEEKGRAERSDAGWVFTGRTGSGIVLTLRVIEAGAGLIAILTGGDEPHIGAVAIAVPRPSLADPTRTSATTSVMTLTGHKDDELAKPLAAKAAARLGRVAVVVAGVHADKATARQIAEMTELAAVLMEEAVAALGK